MKLTISILTVACLALVGCNKKKADDAAPVEPAAEEAAKAGDAPTPDAAAKPADGAEKAEEAAKPTDAAATKTEEAKPADGDAAAAAGAIGVPECDTFYARFAKCEKFPKQSKDAFESSMKGYAELLGKGGDQAKETVTKACKQAAPAWEQALKAQGC